MTSRDKIIVGLAAFAAAFMGTAALGLVRGDEMPTGEAVCIERCFVAGFAANKFDHGWAGAIGRVEPPAPEGSAGVGPDAGGGGEDRAGSGGGYGGGNGHD